MLYVYHRINIVPHLLAPLQYAVGEEGIHVTKGEEEALLEWNQIFRMCCFKDTIYIYSSRIYAYVIPIAALGEHEQEFRALAREKCEPRRLRHI
jgi:hypothetical protein